MAAVLMLLVNVLPSVDQDFIDGAQNVSILCIVSYLFFLHVFVASRENDDQEGGAAEFDITSE